MADASQPRRAERVSDFVEESMPAEYRNRFAPLSVVHYTLHGTDGSSLRRSWTVVRGFEAVAVLVYHATRKTFVLVRQFRPPVYLRSSEEQKTQGNAGFTLELPAGLLDKDGLSAAETGAEEVREETGYVVDASRLVPITVCRGNVGLIGSRIHLYYVEVSDEDADGSGGGGVAEEGEMIDVVHLPAAEAADAAFGGDTEFPASIAFAFWWWERRQRRVSSL